MSDAITEGRTIRHHYRMGPQGHVSFGWDAEDDARIVPMIQRAMDQGYEFWIVKRNPMREEQLTTITDLQDIRHVILRDQDTRELFEQGLVGLINDTDAPLETVRRAGSAAEAATNDTVAHRRMAGG